MTQQAFAKRFNISKATVSAYENGTRLPSYDVLIKIADFFHITTDTLLGYNKRYYIDITDLTPKQRSSINNIISVYNECNSLLEKSNLLNVEKTDDQE